MDRRTFIKLMAAMAASSLVSPAASFAETIEEGAVSGGKVSVGQATALEMAKRFFSVLNQTRAWRPIVLFRFIRSPTNR